MKFHKTIVTAVLAMSAFGAQADDSAITLGKSAYAALCATCHGDDATGGGEVGELFRVKPPNLTKLSERAGGKFPFSEVYSVIVSGIETPGHGPSDMPIWGDYFMADAVEDRGANKPDAIYIAAGRALSLAYYLESVQE